MNNKNLITGIFLSSNREKPEFEQKIRNNILSKSGDMPIISVTQKPIDFGQNICVGDVGVSGFNFIRQWQIGLENAKTKFVLSLEADCLYSPDYFTFVPPKLDAVYRNTNNYVLPYKQDYFYKKDSQTAFQIAGRDFLLSRLDYLLDGQPQWNTKMKNFPKEIGKPFLESWETFKTKFACFGIKTGEGMRKQTHHDKEPISSLEYWGSAKQIAKQIRKKYYEN